MTIRGLDNKIINNKEMAQFRNHGKRVYIYYMYESFDDVWGNSMIICT